MTIQHLTTADVEHREEFRDFVITSAEPWHRAYLSRLYKHFDDYNVRYFADALTVPYIVFGMPGSARMLGVCQNISDFGGKLQITLRRSLFEGNDKLLRSGPAFAEGRARFIADVLLHELVHQYHFELTGLIEVSYKGHGPAFAGECTRIGALLGLPPVRSAKARGKDKELPSCGQWPHNVRPPDYYLGAFIGDPDQADDQVDDQADEQTDCMPVVDWSVLLEAAELHAQETGTRNALQALEDLAALMGGALVRELR